MVGIGFPKNREQFENAVSGANPELRANTKRKDYRKTNE